MSDRAPDPLGKRALYWYPVDGGRHAPRAGGKRALFSDVPADADDAPPIAADDPMPERGVVVVDCSRCAGSTRIGLLDLALLQFPFGAWIPGRPFGHRMTCPRCRRRSWVSLTLAR